MHLRHVPAIVALGVLLPFSAGALSVDELQSQITSLLAQIEQLQEQLKSVQTTTPPAPSAVVPSAYQASSNIVCPVFNYALSRGMRGDAVTALQKFLVGRGLLAAGSVTGFYGPLTETAVRNFQVEQDIVSSGAAASTGWGVVGARTSAAIIRVCPNGFASQPASLLPASCRPAPPPTSACPAGWQALKDMYGCTTSYRCSLSLAATATTTATTTPSAWFSATPVSGTAPLGVVFRTNRQGAQIDFGDGGSAVVSPDCTTGLNGSRNCNTGSYFASHYYRSAGAYTAELKGIPVNGTLPALYGRVTITVQ